MKPTDPFDLGGWDIGGAHVKGVRVRWRAGHLEDVQSAVRPFEIWKGKERLPDVLHEVAEQLGLHDTVAMAITMTAELSDVFRTKREGVLFVLDSVRHAFPHSSLRALDSDGRLVRLEEALLRPLDFAATNWVASALFVARRCNDCLLVDVGSTTTDVIPIRNAMLEGVGRTDLSRLAAGELVYTGVVRTNPNTLTDTVPVRGRMCRVAAESFCVMADVYVLLDRLTPTEYTCPTPDGRDISPDACAERLARLVCTDVESLADEEILKVAGFLFERQVQKVTEAVLQVLSRTPDAYNLPLVGVGVGSFLATEIGRRAGLRILDPKDVWGPVDGVALPAAAVACILRQELGDGI